MSTDSKSNILLFALILSLGLNIYEVLRDSGLTFCDNSGRFDDHALVGGGTEIPTADAKNLVMKYRDAHPNPEVTGVVFSKLVFDNIFNDPAINSVTFDLVMPDDKNYNLIVKGYKSSTTEITCSQKNSIFIAQTICPSDCSSW
jgi:hypothetical protein